MSPLLCLKAKFGGSNIAFELVVLTLCPYFSSAFSPLCVFYSMNPKPCSLFAPYTPSCLSGKHANLKTELIKPFLSGRALFNEFCKAILIQTDFSGAHAALIRGAPGSFGPNIGFLGRCAPSNTHFTENPHRLMHSACTILVGFSCSCLISVLQR